MTLYLEYSLALQIMKETSPFFFLVIIIYQAHLLEQQKLDNYDVNIKNIKTKKRGDSCIIYLKS